MKYLKFFLPAVFALAFAPNVHAAALAPGKVQALLVVGDVQIVDATNTRKPLTKGMTFEEGNIVVAGANSGATLVFSNGATMRVKENGQIKIDKFEQAPFDEAKEGTFMRLSRDPSQSVTELDLRNGTLQGEVKELNKTENSSFTVKTPAGSAGIRGTIVSITVTRDSAGNVTGVTANCVAGNIGFTPAAGVTTSVSNNGTSTTVSNSGLSVDAGGAVQVSLTTNANGQVVASVTGQGVTSAQAAQAVADLYTAINTIRTDAGLAPLAAPQVTVGGTVTNGGTTVTQTTSVSLDPGTASTGLNTIFNASPNATTPPGNNPGPNADTGGGSGTGAGINTNPTLSQQSSTGGSTGTGSPGSGSGSGTTPPP